MAPGDRLSGLLVKRILPDKFDKGKHREKAEVGGRKSEVRES
jgi:hypothetical protein